MADRPEAYTEPAGDGPPAPGLIRVEAEAARQAAEVSAELTRSQADEHAKALTEQVGAMAEQGMIRTEADQHAHDSDLSGQQTRTEADTGRQAAEESAEKTRVQANEHQVLTTVALARVASAAEGLGTQVTALTASYAADKEEARTARRRYLASLALALLTILIIGVIAVGYLRGQAQRAQQAARAQAVSARELQLIQQQQRTSVEQRKAVIATQKQLISCTDPAGACKRKGDAQLAATILGLNRAGVLRVACAPDYQTLPFAARVTAINACVTRNLKGAK